MKKVKCYQIQVGDIFSECVHVILDEVKGKSFKNVVLIIDDIHIQIDRSSTARQLKRQRECLVMKT